MPLTESGRAFWSMDETEALLAAAPRWGFSAAKLRENVAELSHFSTKQVSSKLADLQIQNRGGSRPSASKKKGSSYTSKRERYSLTHDTSSGSAMASSSSFDNLRDPNYEPSSPAHSPPSSPQQESAPNKKRERTFASEFSPPDSKRPALGESRVSQNRMPFIFPGANPMQAFGQPSMPTLPSPFSTAAFAAAAAALTPGGIVLPPMLGIPPSAAASLFMPPSDPSSQTNDHASLKRALLLKEQFQAPQGTKPSLLEVPHPAIRCYASADLFKIVIHPVILGTTLDILIPQEPLGAQKAILKIDWKLSPTSFDADFDFRRHTSLTELYHCPLPITLNKSFSYFLHHSQDALCVSFPLERPSFSSLESAIAALSTLAGSTPPSATNTASATAAAPAPAAPSTTPPSANPTAAPAAEEEASSSATANAQSPASSSAASPTEEGNQQP